MSNALADQLGWCITTQDYLNSLTSELKYVANSYKTEVDNLREAHYVQEYMPSIEGLANEFEGEIDRLIRYIQDEHQAYIQAQSDAITARIHLN